MLLQGTIDLLAVDGNEAVVIDYKYSSLDVNSLKAKYTAQLDLYAYAVQVATGIKVKKKLLLNIFTGDVVEID